MTGDGNALLRLGMERFHAGAVDEAAAHLEAAIERFTGQPERQAAARVELALVHIRREDPRSLARAEELLAAAREDAPPGSETAAAALHAAGYLAFRAGRDEECDLTLREALREAPAGSPVEARILDTIGAHLDELGDFRGAIVFYQRSLELKRRLGDRWGEAVTLGNLGRAYLDIEEYGAAAGYFRDDLAIAAELGDQRSLAQLDNHLGQALLGQGLRVEARAAIEAGMAIAEAHGYDATAAYCWKDLAAVALEDGRPAEALALAEGKALPVFEAMGLREGKVYCLAVIAQSWQALWTRSRSAADLDRARRAYESAIELGSAQQMPRQVVDLYARLARLHAADGRDDAALSLLRDHALPIAERFSFNHPALLRRLEEVLRSVSEAEYLRLLLRRHVSVSAEILHASSHGQRRRVTVFFCDLRGFTAYCQSETDPGRAVATLDEYLREIGQALRVERGIIDKYIGDNVMAYFEGDGAARRACAAALRTIDRVDRLNEQRRKLGQVALAVGVGIATGEVILGNIGFLEKQSFTVIGTPVNLAARLVGAARSHPILIDDATRALIPDLVADAVQQPLKDFPDAQVFALRGRR